MLQLPNGMTNIGDDGLWKADMAVIIDQWLYGRQNLVDDDAKIGRAMFLFTA